MRIKRLLAGFGLVQGFMAVLFGLAALLLTAIAARIGWNAATGGLDLEAAQQIIEAVGLLAAAVVAWQIAQTIFEEEVARFANVSAPTRVRRFLSRFMVVLLVALVVEGLVATFKALHDDMALLLYPAALLAGCALLLAAWGLFVRMNVGAEKLEPEAMKEAQQEDQKLK